MNIQFFGAAQQVTGSKHLLTSPKGTRVLLDCGLFQGINTTQSNLHFGFEPSEVDILLLSHAHIDHTGLIPRLVKLGFVGKVFCTAATKGLCEIMLYDSAHIQVKDLERINKRRVKRDETPIELLYDETDVDKALTLFESIELNKPFYLEEGLKVEYFNAGHILGSAGIFITFENENKKLYFTGDIGRPNDKILRSPDKFPQADYIICESTYGNRLHEREVDLKKHLLELVIDTCIKNKGKLIIPAFAVDRTQELVYALDQLSSEGLLPKIQVYVDSPLAVKATMAMKRFREDFNPEILKYIEKDGDAFGFDNLHYITDVNESKALNTSTEPCIIISASGMAEAGRIKHHIANNIENAHNTILMVGYCSPNSLGAALKANSPTVTIFGETKIVNARIAVMDSFSAHADYSEIIELLKCQDASKVQKLILVHGEIESQLAFKEKLTVEGFKNILIPKQTEIIEL